MTQQEVIRASSCSSSLLAISVRKSDNPIILLFSGEERYIINSLNKPMIPSQANVILSEDDWYILSSIAGCTLALMVKQFSAMLASKSTYTIRNEWKQFPMNEDPRLLTFATVDERVLQFDWWGRRYSWGHPRGLHWYHGTAEWTEEGVVLCPWYTLHCRRSMKTHKHKYLQTVCLSLIYSLTILELRPCKDSASCSLWCEKETSSVAASNIYRSIAQLDTQHNKNRWLKKWSAAQSLTGMLLMLRSKDCKVLRASEFRGDAKKRITSCLLCNTVRSCVGRKNHWLKK